MTVGQTHDTGPHQEQETTPRAAAMLRTMVLVAPRVELDHLVRSSLDGTILVEDLAFLPEAEDLEGRIETDPDDMEFEPDEEDEEYDCPELHREFETARDPTEGDVFRFEDQVEAWRDYAEELVFEWIDDSDTEAFFEFLREWPNRQFSLLDCENPGWRAVLQKIRDRYPQLQEGLIRPSFAEPDLVFRRRGTELEWEVNGGIEERLRRGPGARTTRDVKTGAVYIDGTRLSIPFFLNILQYRRDTLSIIARFVVKRQKAFLMSEDLVSGLRRLSSATQKELISPGERTKDIWSRALKDKFFTAPCCSFPLPLKLLFQRQCRELQVLTALVRIRAEQGKPPLLAEDQLFVLKRLCPENEIQPQTLRSTYWKLLRQLFPGSESRWRALGIWKKSGRKIDPADLNQLTSLVQAELS